MCAEGYTTSGRPLGSPARTHDLDAEFSDRESDPQRSTLSQISERKVLHSVVLASFIDYFVEDICNHKII